MADHGTNDDHGTDDGLWAEFDREFGKNNAAHEPTAAERQAGRTTGPARSRRRPWAAALAAALAAGLAVLSGLSAFLLWPGPGGSPAVRSVSSATGAAPPSVTAPSGSAAASATAPGVASGATPTAAAPLSVFPAQVRGHTLLAKATHPSCTDPDTVAPTLAGLLARGHGCLGVDTALYRDAGGDRFTLVLFTLKDPVEAVTLAMTLGTRPDDHQVAVQEPPKDSGLRALPADSGLVQTFAGRGHTLLVGLAQWADGRSSDFNALVGGLTPLTDAVLAGTPS
ncbi:hypothetical protein [Kitasatospora paranensis]|uniref:Uncharacterized protein n=1 Tax=Kitasatospora paranensis TaxID=258053 RepID=A0ABW2G325_9ACTN